MKLLAAIAVTALTLGVAGCGDDDSDSDESDDAEEAATIEIDGETANNEGTEAVSGDSIEFEEDDFYFEPTVLTGEAGQKVTLEITNEGDSEHNLTIEDQGIDEDTEPGETASVDVEIPESGLIPFYCAFHTAQDMRGALAVTGSEPTASAASDTERRRRRTPAATSSRRHPADKNRSGDISPLPGRFGCGARELGHRTDERKEPHVDMRRVGAGVFLGTTLLVASPASAAMSHVVQPGETLWSIAAANGMATEAVAAYNGVSSEYHVILGETIEVPSADEAAATGTTTSATPAAGSGLISSPWGQLSLDPAAADSWNQMAAAAMEQFGVDLHPAGTLSAMRTYEQQALLYQQFLDGTGRRRTRRGPQPTSWAWPWTWRRRRCAR